MSPSTELTERPTEVLEPGQPSLAELAATANRGHAAVVKAAIAMVEHAIEAGDALSAARARIGSHDWTGWLDANFHAARTTANKYMRIAHYKDLVVSEGIESANKADIYLRGLAGPWHRGRAGHPEHVKQEARRLRAEGLNYPQIGRLIGVSEHGVRLWCEPGFAERRDAHRRRDAQTRRQLAEVEQSRRIKRAVRKAGAATQEAWAMAERMQDVIAQAQRETHDSEARRHLSEAGVHYRKMRDEIVRALGVS